MDLDRLNAVALITEATSAMGGACARVIAKSVAGGLILADRNEDALARLADELEALKVAPERVSTLAFDVTDPDRWAQAGDFIRTQYGRIDWAVLNADAARDAAAQDSDLVDWSRLMPASLDGVTLALRHAGPLMQGNFQGGAIVITAPSAAIKIENGALGAKGGLMPLVRAAAQAGAAHTVRVNAIAVGSLEAKPLADAPLFHDMAAKEGGPRAAFEALGTRVPPLARYAAKDDVAQLAVMLLSDENPMTGATLVVDGGYTL
jgi:NAD(P)-dependent dehydrogenase (short-subunit alcohol dehydrogenase family)